MNSRIAEPGDISQILDLFDELRGSSATDGAAIKQQFEKEFKNTNRAVLVVEDENSIIIGVSVVNLVFKLPKIECRIDEVVVAAAYQGKGYGKQLIDACEEWAWKNGANLIEMTSRPTRKAANGLYQKLGYELRDTNVYVKGLKS